MDDNGRVRAQNRERLACCTTRAALGQCAKTNTVDCAASSAKKWPESILEAFPVRPSPHIRFGVTVMLSNLIAVLSARCCVRSSAGPWFSGFSICSFILSVIPSHILVLVGTLGRPWPVRFAAYLLRTIATNTPPSPVTPPMWNFIPLPLILFRPWMLYCWLSPQQSFT